MIKAATSHGCGGRHELWLWYALQISVGWMLCGRPSGESRTSFRCGVGRCQDLEFLYLYLFIVLLACCRSLSASLSRLLARPERIRKCHALLNFNRFHFYNTFLHYGLLLLLQPPHLLLSRNSPLFARCGSVYTVIAFLLSKRGSLKLLLL